MEQRAGSGGGDGTPQSWRLWYTDGDCGCSESDGTRSDCGGQKVAESVMM